MSVPVAFFTPPHLGGILTHFELLRDNLDPAEWDLRCWTEAARERVPGFRWVDVPGAVRVAAPADADGPDERALARAYVEEVVRRGVRIVMPMNDRAAISAVPHLPADVHVVSSCFDITAHSYAFAAAHADRLTRAVATSPRQRDDLIGRPGLPAGKVAFHPLTVDASRFDGVRPNGPGSERPGPLRVLYAGRLEERQKAVLALPIIAAALRDGGTAFRLTVAGDGPDAAALRQGFADRGFRIVPAADDGEETDVSAVAFTDGFVDRDAVPALMGRHDVLLLPSRHEGFGLVLVEAMCAGAVPVASRVRGVTDYVVRDGETGLLCPPDAPAAVAAAVAGLAADRPRLARMAARAAADARDRFSAAQMGRDYDRLFREVLSEPPPTAGGAFPRPWDEWKPFLTPAMRRGRFTRWIPKPVRAALRAVRDGRLAAGGP